MMFESPEKRATPSIRRLRNVNDGQLEWLQSGRRRIRAGRSTTTASTCAFRCVATPRRRRPASVSARPASKPSRTAAAPVSPREKKNPEEQLSGSANLFLIVPAEIEANSFKQPRAHKKSIQNGSGFSFPWIFSKCEPHWRGNDRFLAVAVGKTPRKKGSKHRNLKWKQLIWHTVF